MGKAILPECTFTRMHIPYIYIELFFSTAFNIFDGIHVFNNFDGFDNVDGFDIFDTIDIIENIIIENIDTFDIIDTIDIIESIDNIDISRKYRTSSKKAVRCIILAHSYSQCPKAFGKCVLHIK